MPIESLPPKEPIPFKRSFRHLLVFQIKLFADAFRDILFSPLSFVAFIFDSIFKPNAEDSMAIKLMHLGQRSDRVINLFNEYMNDVDYTIDDTVKDVENVIQREMGKHKEVADSLRGQSVDQD